ncbi:hypothetical protein [Dactylosporangium salmoneum]|uniref:Uncharacterized protein n=1 Tax=Dactylosporangium salmoneum TaxID=53361 RepID=A0ABN3H7P3_9ACTN
MKYWETRGPDDVAEWLDQVTSLPWAEPFPVALCEERFGWRTGNPTARTVSAERPRLPYAWKHVAGDNADGTVSNLRIRLDQWFGTEDEPDVDDSPSWLRYDLMRRVAGQLTDLYGPPDDARDTRPHGESRYWYRDGHFLVVHAGPSTVTLQCGRRRGDAVVRWPDPQPGPASWDDLAGRIARALPRLGPNVMLHLTDRDDNGRGAYYQWWDGGRQQMTESYGGGASLGIWMYDKEDETAKTEAVTAGLRALAEAGTAGPDRLGYRAHDDSYPGIMVPIDALGLPWRTAPESLWRTKDSGEPLPWQAAQPGDTSSYEALFDQPRFDVEPVALGRWDVVWDGTGWGKGRHALEERGPLQVLAKVDRLTAERIALSLTGVALPA